MKNFTIYIGTLMFLITISYIIYSGVSFLLNDYVNPCLIENPSDFDCWNLSNTIISLIITIIGMFFTGKFTFKLIKKFIK